MSDVTDLKAEVLLLCKENKQLRADQAHWELGNCPSCPNIADLQEALDENDKLRELFNGWRYCHNTMRNSPRHENCPLFRETDDYSDYHNWCRLDELMTELGIEVPS